MRVRPFEARGRLTRGQLAQLAKHVERTQVSTERLKPNVKMKHPSTGSTANFLMSLADVTTGSHSGYPSTNFPRHNFSAITGQHPANTLEVCIYTFGFASLLTLACAART